MSPIDGATAAPARHRTSPMNQQERLIIEEIVSHACVGLFADYDVAFEPRVGHGAPSCPEVAGIIGFSAPSFRGSVLIGAPIKTLLACSCVQGIDIDPLDWAGEIANQLLGRIKTGLMDYGVDIQLATPVSVCGGDLQVHTNETGEIWSLVFDTPFGQSLVHLSGECAPELRLERSHGIERTSAVEGELMFF